MTFLNWLISVSIDLLVGILKLTAVFDLSNLSISSTVEVSSNK